MRFCFERSIFPQRVGCERRTRPIFFGRGWRSGQELSESMLFSVGTPSMSRKRAPRNDRTAPLCETKSIYVCAVINFTAGLDLFAVCDILCGETSCGRPRAIKDILVPSCSHCCVLQCGSPPKSGCWLRAYAPHRTSALFEHPTDVFHIANCTSSNPPKELFLMREKSSAFYSPHANKF